MTRKPYQYSLPAEARIECERTSCPWPSKSRLRARERGGGGRVKSLENLGRADRRPPHAEIFLFCPKSRVIADFPDLVGKTRSF
jgi:hypothetical protein